LDGERISRPRDAELERLGHARFRVGQLDGFAGAGCAGACCAG
jgi:hypothetical protein